MSNFPSDEYKWKWKKQNGLELWSGLAMIWCELTSFILCCSAVRRRLRCIVWGGTMWQYWTARILPMLSTGRWHIWTLLIEGTTILRDVCCNNAARVFALQDLLTCFWIIIIIITVTNPSKSVEVHMPFWTLCCCCLYMILVLYLTISCMVQVLEYWMFYYYILM